MAAIPVGIKPAQLKISRNTNFLTGQGYVFDREVIDKILVSRWITMIFVARATNNKKRVNRSQRRCKCCDMISALDVLARATQMKSNENRLGKLLSAEVLRTDIQQFLDDPAQIRLPFPSSQNSDAGYHWRIQHLFCI